MIVSRMLGLNKQAIFQLSDDAYNQLLIMDVFFTVAHGKQ